MSSPEDKDTGGVGNELEAKEEDKPDGLHGDLGESQGSSTAVAETDTSDGEGSSQSTDRFTFVRELGTGVLGESFEVIDEGREKRVCLKILRRCHPQDLERFRLEFGVLARLHHPVLARYYDLLDPGGTTHDLIQAQTGIEGIAYTQEMIEGGLDLLTYLGLDATEEETRVLRKRRKMRQTDLDIDETADKIDATAPGRLARILFRLEQIIPSILEGLEHLHRYHKVHGSLRPSNILIGRDGGVFLTDFGLVHWLFKEGNGKEIPFTQAPENIPYLAPEAQLGDPREESDLYSLGCVLFEAISGKTPSDALELSEMDVSLKIPPLAELVVECPASWGELVDGLLDDDPEKRPDLHRLRRVVEGNRGRAVSLPQSLVEPAIGTVHRQGVEEVLHEEAVECVEERRFQMVMLDGALGVGKTTVMHRLAHWSARRGWTVLRGRFPSQEGRVYQAWEEVVDGMMELMGALTDGQASLMEDDRRAASVLFPRLGQGDELPEVSRLAAVAGFRRVLSVLSDERPILLLLDDLHNAAGDSAILLVDLLNEIEDVRCFIVGSWRHDAPGKNEGLLRDLDLALVPFRRVTVGGFRREETSEFLRHRNVSLELATLRAVIDGGRVHPLLLEWLMDGELRSRYLDEFGQSQERVDGSKLLGRYIDERLMLYRDDLRTRAILEVLSVADRELAPDELLLAVEHELRSSVLPQESTAEAIHGCLVDLRKASLIRDERNGSWRISHDMVRECVLAQLDAHDLARLSTRISAGLPEDDPEAMEWEIRGNQVTIAEKHIVAEAHAAEKRYAWHRAARLLRWALENEEQLELGDFEPGIELARVEHLGGALAEAARHYASWAETARDTKEVANARLDELSARLEAGDLVGVEKALDAGLACFNEAYQTKFYDGISYRFHRLRAALSRWSADRAKVGELEEEHRLRGTMYFVAASLGEWLRLDCARHFEARLTALAERTGDAELLGMERLKIAESVGRSGLATRSERVRIWLEESHAFFSRIEDPVWLAQVSLHRAVQCLRFGQVQAAAEWFEETMGYVQRFERRDDADLRMVYYWRGRLQLRLGDLAEAKKLARQLLHLYRHDSFAASHAWELLAHVSLLQGEMDDAERYLDAMERALPLPYPCLMMVRRVRLSTWLKVGRGQPDVAVAHLLVLEKSLSDRGVLDIARADVDFHLALGQAACSLLERANSMDVAQLALEGTSLRKIRRSLKKRIGEVDGRSRSEIRRLFARIFLLKGQLPRALRESEKALAALKEGQDPICRARCLDARSVILKRQDDARHKENMENAAEIYRASKAMYPLVLEGWPLPRPLISLKEDV